MKRFLALALLLVLLAVCVAAPASATRSLQKGDTTITLDRLDQLDRDPAAAIERNCAKLGHNPAQIGFDEATCTEPGYYVLECTRCHKEWKEKAKDKLGHNYQYAQTSNATCEKDGKEWYDCTRCGDSQYQTIPKLGHDYKVTSTVDATCGKDGKKIYTCSRLGCGSQKSETIPATGKHNWVHSHTNRDDVECVAGGTAYYHCSVCGDQKNESVPATGHKWKAVSALSATCDSPKIVTYQCSTCGEKKTEKEGSAAEHIWEQTYYEPATCAADGYRSYKCATCSKSKTETIPATDNCTYSEWIVATNATCEKDGLKVAACTQCGDKKEQKIPATGHKWKDGQIIKQPTCTEDGKASSVCERCGKTDNARIEIGEKIKTVENAMKKNGLYCSFKSGNRYVYQRPIQLYSMCVNDEGFDSYIEVVLDENKCVESISWNAYTE